MGWLLKRIELFPELLQENKNILDEFFLNLDAEIISEKNNTWMDSIERDSGIEIQAMKLFALNLASILTNKKEEFRKKEYILKKEVREIYWNGNVLLDSPDKKVRPNVFIAYYFYPQLLEKKEWEICFNTLIKNLWCEWGGFSTLDKKNPLFHKNYTGETGESYHNGDSWFWINNLGGWVLTDLDKEKYYIYIKKILDASTREILFSGAIGNHSELSSASHLKSEGAICQAFSAGMYLEFVKKLMAS
jgi:glycogen debranching enzyme